MRWQHNPPKASHFEGISKSDIIIHHKGTQWQPERELQNTHGRSRRYHQLASTDVRLSQRRTESNTFVISKSSDDEDKSRVTSTRRIRTSRNLLQISSISKRNFQTGDVVLLLEKSAFRNEHTRLR